MKGSFCSNVDWKWLEEEELLHIFQLHFHLMLEFFQDLRQTNSNWFFICLYLIEISLCCLSCLVFIITKLLYVLDNPSLLIPILMPRVTLNSPQWNWHLWVASSHNSFTLWNSLSLSLSHSVHFDPTCCLFFTLFISSFLDFPFWQVIPIFCKLLLWYWNVFTI